MTKDHEVTSCDTMAVYRKLLTRSLGCQHVMLLGTRVSDFIPITHRKSLVQLTVYNRDYTNPAYPCPMMHSGSHFHHIHPPGDT